MDRAQRIRDEWIALRCQAGEASAFEDLVGELTRPLLYYLTKLLGSEPEAFDVLQEVWADAIRGIRKLRDATNLRPWLYRKAHGLAIDRLRRDRARRNAEQSYAEAAATEGPEPSFTDDDPAALHKALDTLSVDHRAVLVLHFLEQMPLAEVAAVVGCPEGTVKSRIHFAKRALKDALIRGGYDTTT